MTMMKPKDKGKDPATPLRVSGHEQPRLQIVEPPDGGWGWVVTFASFLCNVIVDGICLSYGSIKKVFEDHFRVTATASALIGSLLTGSYLMIGKSYLSIYLSTSMCVCSCMCVSVCAYICVLF